MSKKVLWVLASMFVVACQGSDITNPGRLPATPASLGVNDGTDPAGNKDFWFLPPMVKSPAGNPLYLDNGFDGSLAPVVHITRVSPPGGIAVSLPATVGAGHYAANWQIPAGAATYIISVTVLGTELGSADVQTAANTSGLKNIDTNEFIPLADGRTLPIKFVIENCALEDDNCETVNLTEGGTVDTDEGGVTIPPQPNGPTVKVFVEECEGIPTDLPKKSNCLRVTTDPPLTTPLVNPAIVWVCEGIPADPSEQEERYTLYKFDAPNTTTALPHADDQCGDPPPPSFSVGSSVKGILADLVRGRFRSAGRQLATLVGPRLLYATTMLDVGAGGETPDFSDFQLVYPGSMAACPDHPATGLAGAAITAKVCVTDVGGDPVLGATVHFGAPLSTSVETDEFGVAALPWTLALGANSVTVSGNGIGAAVNNGPREGIDPFQPLSPHFDDGEEVDGPAVPALAGSFTLSATGANSVTAVDFGDNGYNSYGPFPISSPFSLPAGWPLPTTPGVSPTVGGDSPFSAEYSGCGVTTGFPGATFPENTDILVTKSFSTPNVGTLTITIQIDNDAKVYLDGTDITSTGVGTTGFEALLTYNGVSGWWKHDGCADIGAPVFTRVSVPAGNHTLSIWAHDRGTVGYLNTKVVLTP